MHLFSTFTFLEAFWTKKRESRKERKKEAARQRERKGKPHTVEGHRQGGRRWRQFAFKMRERGIVAGRDIDMLLGYLSCTLGNQCRNCITFRETFARFLIVWPTSQLSGCYEWVAAFQRLPFHGPALPWCSSYRRPVMASFLTPVVLQLSCNYQHNPTSCLPSIAQRLHHQTHWSLKEKDRDANRTFSSYLFSNLVLRTGNPVLHWIDHPLAEERTLREAEEDERTGDLVLKPEWLSSFIASTTPYCLCCRLGVVDGQTHQYDKKAHREKEVMPRTWGPIICSNQNTHCFVPQGYC